MSSARTNDAPRPVDELYEWAEDTCAVCNEWLGYRPRIFHEHLCPRHSGEVRCPFCGKPEALTCTCK